MVQLHKKFVSSQVKELIERILKKEIERKYIQQILNPTLSAKVDFHGMFRRDEHQETQKCSETFCVRMMISIDNRLGW